MTSSIRSVRGAMERERGGWAIVGEDCGGERMESTRRGRGGEWLEEEGRFSEGANGDNDDDDGGGGTGRAVAALSTAASAENVAAALGCAAVAITAEAAIGLLPWSSLRSHLRESSLISFFKWRSRVCGGPFPSYRAQDGTRGERAHWRPTTRKPKMIIK